jgi:mono/diheme cytochrome c family protein
MRTGIGIVVLALAGAVGCGGGGSSEPGGGGTAGGEYAGPVASTDVAHGQSRYEAVCGGCHNAGAPQLANVGWTAERMRQQIREGSGQMPAINEGRLSAEDMEAVLAYLQTIGGVEGGAAPMPAAEGGTEGATTDESAAPAQ